MKPKSHYQTMTIRPERVCAIASATAMLLAMGAGGARATDEFSRSDGTSGTWTANSAGGITKSGAVFNGNGALGSASSINLSGGRLTMGSMDASGTISAIPESSAAALGGLGMLMLLRRRRM